MSNSPEVCWGCGQTFNDATREEHSTCVEPPGPSSPEPDPPGWEDKEYPPDYYGSPDYRESRDDLH